MLWSQLESVHHFNDWHAIHNIHNQLNQALDQEKVYWCQQSSVQWLFHRNCNTSFFHKKSCTKKFKKSHYFSSRLSWSLDHQWYWNGFLLLSYFQHLFQSHHTNLQSFSHIPIQPLILSLKVILFKSFTADEIKDAVWKLGPWKVSGLNGIHIGFYKENCHIVGLFVAQTSLKILSGQQSLDLFNYFDHILIPKSKNIRTPNDLRPIGLCNNFYKIFSKTHCERLKKERILFDIIWYNQGAFLKARGVAPMTLAGFELIHQIINGTPSINHSKNIV